jgi:Fe-S cluster biosynthesis and repair protein YggX
MPHTVVCARYKQEMEGLDEPPFDSEFGQKIYDQVEQMQEYFFGEGSALPKEYVPPSH